MSGQLSLARKSWPFGDLPRQHYAAILADPPWHFRNWSKTRRTQWRSDRSTSRHYEVMDLQDIAQLPISDLAAADAHLFLWATGPCLMQAFTIMDAWGFRYSGIAFNWVKLKRKHDPSQLRFLPTSDSDLHVGLGFTTRKNTELCLLGRRGSAKRLAKDVREVILAPVREHSRKPDEARERIQRYCAGPYLELFARTRHPGWDCWGNETDKFGSTA